MTVCGHCENGNIFNNGYHRYSPLGPTCWRMAAPRQKVSLRYERSVLPPNQAKMPQD